MIENHGRILYEKDGNSKTPMASTTKIMTCILALENCSLNEIVKISKKASSISGSTLGLKENSEISLNDLLYGLMLRSGNDCAIAIAEHISGSEENFSNLMNKKAKELRLENTHFVTPHGLDNPEHYTTAYELSLLTDYALKNEEFKKIVSTKNYTILLNNHYQTLSNTNELLGNLGGVYGVKTGFTFEAGRCLVSACKKENLDIIVVVLGANTKKIRTTDSINLINYIFNTYNYFNLQSTINLSFENYISIFQKKYLLEKTTTPPQISYVPLTNYEFPLSNSEIKSLHTKIYTIDKFSNKTALYSNVGVFEIYTGNNLLISTNIILKNKLIKNNWKYYFNLMFKLFKSG